METSNKQWRKERDPFRPVSLFKKSFNPGKLRRVKPSSETELQKGQKKMRRRRPAETRASSKEHPPNPHLNFKKCSRKRTRSTKCDGWVFGRFRRMETSNKQWRKERDPFRPVSLFKKSFNPGKLRRVKPSSSETELKKGQRRRPAET
ncbi:hypothetical protein CDAR_579871 [Caerostris darwini]|uniref:Uncharacterized protein n=1 Tax=Caerostris darwini TaxID=1538125 RepID=A0AAV4PXI4_9ARAC|nr:hypothetical protein CDAR_579871 [Caerostris darwini]